MELTPEFAQQCREDALRKYEDEKSKFGLQMMTMGYYKVKSLLSEEGLRKVGIIDMQRESDISFNKEFSEQMWRSTEEAWTKALEQLIVKICDAYGLKIDQDIKSDHFEEVDENEKLDFYA